MMHKLSIGGRNVGGGERTFVIAEAGVNHNGKIALAKKLIDVAREAGADAVKFQTFRADKLVTRQAGKAVYQAASTDASESQFDMLKKLELSDGEFRELDMYCREREIIFLSTPFDEGSADFLETLGMPAFKIASGEITNLPFLAHIATKKKPMIISTGMAGIGEVEKALETIGRTGNERVALLHCVSNYPTEPGDVNLRAMETLRHAFCVPVGYSDHTLGIEIALAAAALGACVIEKHFTLDRGMTGPDHGASLEPDQLREMVRGIRTIEQALGDGRKRPAASEQNTAAVARRSLVAARDIEAGEVLREDMIVIRRPGNGLAPALLPRLVGRKVKIAISEGELLSLEMLG